MTKVITIILEESNHAKHYPISNSLEQEGKGSLVHKDEFNKVMNIIENIVPNSEQEADKLHLHNTITVLGSRGSGKTSFLLSIKHGLANNVQQYNKSNLLSGVEVLDIIDPTLIEDKGHVFLNVIARIMDLVDKRLKAGECNPLSESFSITRKEWRTSLNKLAAGLPSIDGIGNSHNDGWQDPEFVMDNGLKAVDASLKLAENFNNFLELSLKILHKTVFLLLFDDIDVDASKGWAVLETIRKYFTGARLITIISGDIQLYSTVVRQKKWQNFGQEILNYEGKQLGKITEFNDMITALESQYLQKILQPRNRIHLSTIGEMKFHDPSTKIYVYKEANDDSKEERDEIKKVYERILAYFGVNNPYQADGYISFLLGLPLRTQVQFLTLFELGTGRLIANNTGAMPIVDVFVSDLYAKRIDSNTAIKNPKNLNRIILQFLLREKKLEELYQLQPITTENTLNASLLTLNFLTSFSIQKDPYLIFDYFIKIGYVRNLIPLLGYKSVNDNVNTPSIEELCANTVILNDNVLKDVAGKIIAYVRGAIDKSNTGSEWVSQAGTIPLFGEAAKAKKNKKFTSDRIDSVLRSQSASYVEWMLVYMPLSSNQYVYKQSSLLTYSSYLLLGAIGELSRKVIHKDEKNGFTELSQLRGYMMPDFKRGNNDTNDNNEDDPQDFPDKNPEDFDIEGGFVKWISEYPEEPKISIHLLGKIATRFFYALTNLENKVGSKKLGEIFKAHILAFMNAVLIEDCRENTDFSSELNLNNTNYNDKIFRENLQKIIGLNRKITKKMSEDDYEELLDKLFFSRWLLSCPLFLVYLNPDDTLKIYLKKFLVETHDEKIFEINLSRILDKISTKNDDQVSPGKRLPSLNNSKDYDEILTIMKNAEIEIHFLMDQDFSKTKKILENLGIKSIYESSFSKFIKTMYDKL